MNSEKILNRIIDIFSTMTEADEITADSALIDDLEISSMDVMLLVSNLEAEFNIKVPESEFRKMVTVSDVFDIITALLHA